MNEAFGGLDQFVEAAGADHAFPCRDRIEGLDRAGQRAGVRHGGGASALGRPEFQGYHGLAGGARCLAGLAEHPGVAHPLQIDHDHTNRGIGGEIAHQVRRFEAGLVAGRDHVADADAAILQRLTDRHHDRAGLAGDRHRTRLHGDDAVVDVGEHLFAGAQIAETVRTGDRKPGLLDGLLQFHREPLAFLVLQFAEARGDDGRRARAGRGRVADHLDREAGGNQHQHVIRLVRQAGKILVTGHAPDRFALGIDGIKAAFESVFDQIVPDALGVVARLVGGSDQHDVARMQHRMDALDDVACVSRRRPFSGWNGDGAYLSFHRRNPYPSHFSRMNDRSRSSRSVAFGSYYGESERVATRAAAIVRHAVFSPHQAGRGRDGEAMPASSTARIPVRNIPSKVPAPPIEAIGAPRPLILSRLRRSAPISVPIDPPI